MAIRWNLVIHGAGLILLSFMVMAFLVITNGGAGMKEAAWMLLGTVTAGGYVAFAMGILQALTNPGPSVSEQILLKQAEREVRE